MDRQFLINLELLEKRFSPPLESKERYNKIIYLGENLPPFPNEQRIEENKVHGCQSTLYIYTYLRDPLALSFYTDANALISKGLGALLVFAYEGVHPLTLMQHPPTFLEKWNIPATLSLNRSHGLAHIYNKMKIQTVLLLHNLAKTDPLPIGK